MDELSTPAVSALRQAQDTLIEHSLDRISSAHDFYRTLPEADREQIAAVARLGVTMFVDSVESPAAPSAPSQIFSVAPAALTGVITLEQTLALVRTVLDVVVDEAPQAVPEEDHDMVRIFVLSFGRDVGFAAAEVYARAAEARGAWDARLESVAVDSMLHDAPEDAATRAGTAGWNGTGPVAAVAARTTLDALGVSRLRNECRSLANDCLVSVRGDSVLIVLGGKPDDSEPPAPSPATTTAKKGAGKGAARRSRASSAELLIDQAAMQVAAGLGGSAVVGTVVPGIGHAGRSLRSALAGLRSLPGWREAPNPVHADDLLPERILAGDEFAAEQILSLVHAPLHEMGDPFESTVATYLALGRSLEATARSLFVHANTVRYRLGRVSEQVGWDATDARDGLMLHMAIIVGRLRENREI
ncbi:PucR family transcriptional regulator [Actinomyces sp. 2119]|uniref:PucR family transcriptional regulator n=1 Tax=Actinomyces lilanjuaniae TaxID=2321394 RepID=A0ABN5PPV7_9ACTO|nr:MULTISPECIES: helix-turn-helix domain-containing protein [Actinomyces]AYD89703.1 PucR family transcriptional regulator [Actinomyces lilanjuaniae]RJF44666.1 PucR family transcriptional regulator [Actinomyces sp. 2119]